MLEQHQSARQLARSLNMQLLLDGLMIGAIFALAAYGLALVWGVMNVKNLAQGRLRHHGRLHRRSAGRPWESTRSWALPVADRHHVRLRLDRLHR